MKLFNSNWRSFQAKLTLALIIMTSLILFGFGVYDYFRVKSKMTLELQAMTEAASQRMLISMLAAIWNLDTEQGLQVAKSGMKDDRVYAVVVRETNVDTPFLAIKRNEESWVAEAFKGDVLSNYITSRQDVQKDGNTLGTVEAYVT